jgi:hypothetical protein
MNVSFLLLLCVAPIASPGEAPTAQAFREPPMAARPWVYWWWVHGNVTDQSITRDLEAMKRQGVGGLLLFDARGYHDTYVPPPPAPMEFMSPEWRKKLRFAMSEAERLGLEMSMNLSSCAGTLKGPWSVGDDAPKKLLWTSSTVQGPQRIQVELRRDGLPRSWDVAVIAARHDRQPPGKDLSGAAPSLSENWRDVQTKPQDAAPVVEVLSLSNKVDDQGRLTWDVPEGHWTLLRFVCAIMEGYDSDVDVLSARAVEAYFQRMGQAVVEDAGPLVGKTFTHFYSVSWEGAVPTWTLGFDREFLAYRGYALDPYLPVLAGMTVRDAEVTQRFLRDYSRTLSDCFLHNCYARLQELCHRAGLKIHCESGGPWDRNKLLFTHADQFAFLSRNDMPQSEFWHPWSKQQTNAKRAAMTAHIYGKPLVAAEAFTHMTLHWSAYPEVLKPAADATFCDGVNRFVWHTFTASPEQFGLPGLEYFAGTHLNPNVTWFEQSRAFLEYLARCQLLLRPGHFVADVCCYTSDRNYERWGRGAKWSAKPSLVLPPGYAYDVINTEVLLDRLSVRDGRLVLPDGMSYQVLVVDLEEPVTEPQVLEKLLDLARQGATIVLGTTRPDKAAGLRDYPACDEQVRRLASELWDAAPEPTSRAVGSGKVLTARTMDDVLPAERLVPDYTGPGDYIHRRTADADIYFVTGEGSFTGKFRVQGREPELWDPVTGRTREAAWYQIDPDGRIAVPLQLPRNGAVFVVFRQPARPQHLVAVTAPPGSLEIQGRTDTGVQFRGWKSGRYTLETNAQRTAELEVGPLPEPLNLPGPWEVRFAPGWGAPAATTWTQLVPWNEHPDEAIRYFSGRATYRQSFVLDVRPAQHLVRLRLGVVKHIAEVRVNGQPLGVVWTDPWTVDLTGAVRSGNNELEIDVVNLWDNRLIGDARLPPEKRRTKTNVPLDAQTPGHRGYNPDVPLEPSGLLGPVQLEFGARLSWEFP